MNRLFLIIKLEYVQAVCKKSFIITTLLVPILSIALCGLLPHFLSQAKSTEQKVVAVIDQNPGAPYAAQIPASEEFLYKVLANGDAQDDYRAIYQNSPQDLYALVVIPADFATSTQVYIYSEKSVNGGLERQIARSLRNAVRQERIQSSGIDSLEQVIKYCDPEITTSNVKWGKEGEEIASSAEISMLIGIALAFLTYMFVIIYGSMIMNSVVEEKTNRIVEVIISTCKPIELMLGKIVGVALVGITQIVLWSVILSVVGTIFGISSMATTMGGMSGAADALANTPIPQDNEVAQIVAVLLGIDYVQILISFVLYFIGGYLLYASLFAAFGSAVDQASDASQFTGPIIMIMLFALYAGMFCMENPDGPLAFWCSMIPFTSPVVMMIRLPYDLPWYELTGSLVLLYATAFGILWLSSRIYR
ncbi:MAG: ABC transporter permease, partial [Bacteroidales bacterium]|nr:ABC transporter permease [Bacteroidales bacterium]